MKRRALVAGLGTYLLAVSVAAFDGAEHERAADNALLLAFSYWMEQKRSLPTREHFCKEIDRRFPKQPAIRSLIRRCSQVEEALAYGGIVRAVDAMKYPSEIFVREGTSPDFDVRPIPILPRSYLDLNSKYRIRPDKRRKGRRIAHLAEFYRSLSYNEVHFQNDLLQQMQRLRRDARRTPAKHMYAALVANALADHFLQDFFAPGHMLWPRNHSHDTVALSLHDGTNRIGAYFDVKTGYWTGRLEPLARYIMTLDRESFTYQVLDEYWLKRRPDATATCIGTATPRRADLAGGLAEGLECLLDKFSAGHEPQGRLYFYGDGQLSKSPEQQMLMLLVQAERIYWLLQKADDTPRRLPKVEGIPEVRSFTPDYRRVLVPCPRVSFGHFDFHSEACPEHGPSDDEIRAQRVADSVFEDRVKGALIFSGGGQSPFRSVGSARYQLSFEHVPLGLMANNRNMRNWSIHKPPDFCDFWSLCNFGFSYGLEYLHDGDFTAPGIGLRGIKALPSIGFQVGPTLKFLKYRWDQTDDWNLSWGLRADWGFSLGSLYLAAGKEFYVNDQRALESTGMMSFGFSIAMPVSRIEKYARYNPRYRPGADKRKTYR